MHRPDVGAQHATKPGTAAWEARAAAHPWGTRPCRKRAAVAWLRAPLPHAAGTRQWREGTGRPDGWLSRAAEWSPAPSHCG